MKNKSLVFGVFVLSIGIIWLLWSLGCIGFSIFIAVSKLWPLVLIIVGLSIIFKNNIFVKIFGWLIFLVSVICYSYLYDSGNIVKEKTPVQEQLNSFFEGNLNEKNTNENIPNKNFVEEKDFATKNAKINISLGGIKLNINSTMDNKLFTGFTKGFDIKNYVKYNDNKETAEAKIERTGGFSIKNIGRNELNLSLNQDIIWDMDIDTGAVDGTIDVSHLKIKDLDIEVGAGNLKLMLSDNYKLTKVKMDAGASNIDVFIPKDAALKIKIDGALNKIDFNGIILTEQDNYYISPSYNNSSENSIEIDVSMAAGKITFNSNG